MARARTFVAGLIAVALALAPVGSAFARFNGAHGQAEVAAAMQAPVQGGAHVPHDDGSRSPPPDETAAHVGHAGSSPCDHGKASKKGDCDCCDKQQSACAEFCLQKCFGQLCVMAPDRLAAFSGSDRFRLPPTEHPPDWVAAPRTPPPRS